MRLARYSHQGGPQTGPQAGEQSGPRIGVVINDRIIDIAPAAPGINDDMRALLAAGPALLADVRRLANGNASGNASGMAGSALADVRLLAPIVNPQKFLAIGMNYQDHAEEARKAGVPVPTSQLWFNKQVSCIAGPHDAVHIPAAAPDRVDYEGELGVVIGTRCRRVKAADALQVIAGYCVINDVSARDWQQRSPTFTLGKSWDTHGPMGPWIVTADDVPDPHALMLRTFVNGQLRQQASTALLIYNVWQQIEYLSTVMTLEPGDVLATGTCAGVGIAMKPPRFLAAGDMVRVQIDGIGAIENPLIKEPIEEPVGDTA